MKVLLYVLNLVSLNILDYTIKGTLIAMKNILLKIIFIQLTYIVQVVERGHLGFDLYIPYNTSYNTFG